MNRFFIGICLALATLVLALPAWATVDTVRVQNFSFTPADLTIMHGDTVVWDCILGLHDVHHNATPSLFGNAPASAPWTYSFVFDSIGDSTFHYICTIHSTLMHGSITVQPASSAPEPPSVVHDLQLGQNYPNPFNSQTNIRFSVPTTTRVKLILFNELGQQVRELYNGELRAGNHEISLDATNLATGLYYYRLETPFGILTRKMQYLK